MSDSMRSVGDCEHGTNPDRCWRCLSVQLMEAQAARDRLEQTWKAEAATAFALRQEVEAERAARQQAEGERDRLKALLDKVAPWTCPTCGPHAKVDEDGCCAACGADAALEGRDD